LRKGFTKRCRKKAINKLSKEKERESYHEKNIYSISTGFNWIEEVDFVFMIQDSIENLSEALPAEDTIKFFGASAATAFLGIFSIGVGFSE